jgi:mannose-6-phosphate isomerase-like protein (cupin superfamily)
MSNKLYCLIDQIETNRTNHKSGEKKVLFNKIDVDSNITQVAYGFLQKGKQIELHLHETMEEFFYFTRGVGQISIGKNVFPIKKNSVFRIPIMSEHSIIAFSNLEFFYFGVSN